MALHRHRSFAVVGLGTFGSTIAVELERLGNEVLGIDRDEDRVNALSEEISQPIIADARDERALAEAGLADQDVVIVGIGEDLESSILCTLALKTLGVKAVWVKAANLTHQRILSKIGADRIIQPEREIGLHIAQNLNTPFVIDYLAVGNGLYVVNIEVPEALDSTPLVELALAEREDVHFLGVLRGSTLMADKDLTLVEHDRLLLLGRQDTLRKLEDDL